MLIRKFTLSAAAGVLTFVATSSIAPPTLAADRAAARTVRTAPASIERLRLATPLTRENARSAIDPVLLRSNGSQQVLVRFRSPSVAESSITNPADGIMRREEIRIEQGTFVDRVQRLAPGARMIAEVQGVLNAVVLQADSATIRQIAADPSVARVSRVIDYQADLSETVPYITAKKLQKVGKLTGKGVKVAVLDSGIDYTHVAFGGKGTLEAYEAAAWCQRRRFAQHYALRHGPYATASSKATTSWAKPGRNGPLAPDDDPIDFQGHGTHVADIIGGATGVAPKVDLTRLRSAARSPPPAAARPSSRAWSTRPIRTATAARPIASMWSTCRSVRRMASPSTTTSPPQSTAPPASGIPGRSPRPATRATNPT